MTKTIEKVTTQKKSKAKVTKESRAEDQNSTDKVKSKTIVKDSDQDKKKGRKKTARRQKTDKAVHTLRITQPGISQTNSPSQKDEKGTDEDVTSEQVEISYDKSPTTDDQKKVSE